MKKILLFASILTFYACQEEEPINFHQNEIAGRYEWGSGHWINGLDESDQIHFSTGCEVHLKTDGYYRLSFDEHPQIKLPDLHLSVYEVETVEHWDVRYHYFNLKENPFFGAKLSKYGNYIQVRPARLLYPGNVLNLHIGSNDPDSVYIIKYHAE